MFCIITESNSQKTLFSVVLCTNMAAVTSGENHLHWEGKDPFVSDGWNARDTISLQNVIFSSPSSFLTGKYYVEYCILCIVIH